MATAVITISQNHVQDIRNPPPSNQIPHILPDGFPKRLDSLLAWDGHLLGDELQYILTLEQTDIIELELAVESFKELGLDGDLISRNNFPLPNLGMKLKKLQHDVYSGLGFGLVRGLDPANYSVEDLTMLKLGIASYIADSFGRQDKKRNMLVHIVADNSTKLAIEHHRHSTSSITFHNEESGDIVSWLTRSVAATGGKCIIASSYTVYNVLAAHRPDLIRVLAAADWPFSLPNFHCRPIIFWRKGHLIMNFGRAALIGNSSHPRDSQLPQLTALQREALNYVEKISRATEFEFSTQPGDIHFINNLALLHRRESFTNGKESSQNRHLVRMRLRDSELGWDIPPQLQPEWDSAFEPGFPGTWHLEPMPESYIPLRKQPN